MLQIVVRDVTTQSGNAAAKAGDSELLSLWAGQAAALGREVTAAEVVARTVREADEVLRRLTGG